MPNTTPESDQLQTVKQLIAALAPSERARLRPWILARYDAQGNEHRSIDDARA